MNEVWQAVVALILAVVVGTAGWFGRQQYGAERERRKQAERDRDAANVRAGKSAEAPASPREVVGILRRLRERRERMRKASGGR